MSELSININVLIDEHYFNILISGTTFRLLLEILNLHPKNLSLTIMQVR